MTPAPIAFFAFNRPDHAARTLRALAKNPEANATTLHAFVDGPRHAGEEATVQQVRDVVTNARGFAATHLHAAPTNLGLFESITRGVQTVLDTNDAVIVVEDDIEVAPSFLAYMNDALVWYRDTPEVGSVHAYAPPIKGLPDYYFLRGADCWGWATWADRWALFQSDASTLLDRLVSTGQLDAFSSSHGVGSLLLLLRRAQGKNQSWAILWHASLFLAGRLTLHPGTSFVDNIGNDGSGEHSANTSFHSTSLTRDYNGLPKSIPVAEDIRAAYELRSFLDEGAIGRDRSLRRRLIPIYAKLAARFHRLLP